MYNLYNKVSTVSDRMSFSDLYPERRGGVINPSVLQRATGQALKFINSFSLNLTFQKLDKFTYCWMDS